MVNIQIDHISNRINLAAAAGLCLYLLLVGKIYTKQIMQHDHYLSLATSQHLWQEEEKARRGQIYDINGYPLAANLSLPALEIIPNQVDDAEYAARKISTVIDRKSVV